MQVVRSVSVLAFGLLLAACASNPVQHAAPVAAPATPAGHDNLNATVWMQTAAEYEATVRGIYAAAKRSLDAALADPSWQALPHGESQSGFETKPPAIIVDADETMIDNSAYQARNIVKGRVYTADSWREWVNAQAALAMPGAVDFANYASSKGVTIFFVTNRDAPDETEATIANLRALGFPITEDGGNVMLRGDLRAPADEKSERRRWVDHNYRVVLMLGDNLGDFVDGSRADIATREALVAPYQSWWGERWFMLPNPTYGSWENAVLRSCAKDLSPTDCVRSQLRHDY